MKNKKGEIKISMILIPILIIIIFIIGVVIYFVQESEIKILKDIINKNNIEYEILKGIIYDYYNLPDNNVRNSFIDTKKSCENNPRAFSENGLIEYHTQCISNTTHVKIPIIYYERETKFYLYNGTIIPVVMDALETK